MPDSRWTKYSIPGNQRMLNPHTPNLNVSGRLFAKVMLGVWFLSSTGAHAPQATLTLNFGGKGVVSDSKGLNISSIYGTNCGVRHGPNNGELLLHCHRCMCCMCLSSHFFLFPNAQLIPKGRKYCIFTGTCAACVSRPIFSYSLMRNLFQREENIVFSQVHVLHVSLVPFFPIP